MKTKLEKNHYLVKIIKEKNYYNNKKNYMIKILNYKKLK